MRSLAALLLATTAFADELPTPASDHDPAPPVAAPAVDPADGVVEQAGIGGDTAYGRAGVLELGGNAGLMMSPNFRVVSFSPLVGWFVSDNLELSGTVGVTHIKAGASSSTVWETLVEPSYHVPFNRTTFGFIGMGVGAAYVSQLGTGLAVSPRIGLNVLVGRSSVLTPSLSYEYTTHNIQMLDSEQAKNITLVAVSTSLKINIGYTAMW